MIDLYKEDNLVEMLFIKKVMYFKTWRAKVFNDPRLSELLLLPLPKSTNTILLRHGL